MTVLTEGDNIPRAGPRGARFRALTIDHADGRTLASRRAKALIAAFETDLGGADRLTTAETALIARAALLATMCESHEAEWLQSGEIKVETYTACCNTLRRLLQSVGLQRRPRDVTPSLTDYLNTIGKPATSESEDSKGDG